VSLSPLRERLWRQGREALLLLDQQGVVRACNAAAERMLGLPADEIEGQPFDHLAHLDAMPSLLDALEGVAEEGPVTDYLLVLPNGQEKPVNVTQQDLADVGGGFRVFSLLDIHRRHDLESALIAAKNEAMEAAEQQSSFLARMSHEIRTPLNALLGMAELLAETALNEQQKRYVGTFQAAGESLRYLINDILDLSKLEAGQLVLAAEVFSLRQLLDELILLFEATAQEKGLTLEALVDERVPDTFQGDPQRIKQILINLIGNALKFTRQGKVSVEIQNFPPDLPEGSLHFLVADTGMGIPLDRQATIFEAFQQAEVTTSVTFGGTGLGLTICRRLVGLMRGMIWVESEPGEGSVFHFTAQLTLSSSRAPHLSFAEAVPTGGVALAGKKLLVVDDGRDNRFLIGQFLKNSDCHLTFCQNGAEAVSAVPLDPPDAILMDMYMPVMDGYEATRRIRQWEQAQGHSRTPIIALTASVQPQDIQRCLHSGCDVYLAKPVRKPTLISALEEALTGKGGCPGLLPADESLRGILPVFFEERQEDLLRLNQAISENDGAALAFLGHRLKGAGASFQVGTVEHLGLALEQAQTPEDWCRLRDELDQTLKQMKREFDS
jgi:PAS domain S-box-containing protein